MPSLRPLHCSCDKCRFYIVDQPGGTVGQCRRGPPQVTYVMVPQQSRLGGPMQVGMQNPAGWPGTQAHFWCGEFTTKLQLAS